MSNELIKEAIRKENKALQDDKNMAVVHLYCREVLKELLKQFNGGKK